MKISATKLRTRIVFAILFSAFCGNSGVQAAFDVKIDEEKRTYQILEEGQPVLQYNYGIIPLPPGYAEEIQGNAYLKKYAVPRCDYIHPLYDFDGEPITKDYSRDHAHHRGIYWGWPELQYQGQTADLHALQKAFAYPAGKIDFAVKDGNAVLTAVNDWKWEEKEQRANDQSETIAKETTTITVFPKDKDGRKINVDIHIEAAKDGITLARRGTKHYGGFSIRMQPLPEWKMFDFSEKDADKRSTSPSWVGATWKNPKSDGRLELTVFEKTTNPDYPGDQSNIKEIHWLQPTFPKSGTRYPLVQGKPLDLHYQLWIHNAGSDDDARKEAWKKYQER
ncbi:MAG: PmoA family protein [Planctomycetaceae bacterium]|jgi:hypothetical protein|nr:PmoA family protein [Planctomycetaceae bacterium]